MLKRYSTPSIDRRLHDIIRQAGFRKPTPFQKIAVPVILENKDIIINASDAKGKLAAILASIILDRGANASVKTRNTLVISDSKSDINKLSSLAAKLSRVCKEMPFISCLSREKHIKKELSQTRNNPSIIIGTTERVIDLLRIGSIDLFKTENVIIIYPQKTNNRYDQDILYIFSKLPARKTVTIINKGREINKDLIKTLKKPRKLDKSHWQELKVAHESYLRVKKDNLADYLLKIIISGNITKGAIFSENSNVFKEIIYKLHENGYNTISPDSGTIEKDKFPENTFLLWTIKGRGPNYTGAGFIKFAFILDLRRYINCFNFVSPFLADKARIISFYYQDDVPTLNELEEKNKVSVNRKQPPQNAEVIAGKLKNLVKRIKTEEDPEILDWYKKVFKKNVPIHLRSYVAALLIKESSKDLKFVPVPGENSDHKTLFVSIGKNRRVFPRDLSGIICNTLNITNESIGAIKVLDNYSFIDIAGDHAQRAIDLLDGTDFRGKKITVNFARKRD